MPAVNRLTDVVVLNTCNIILSKIQCVHGRYFKKTRTNFPVFR